MKPFMSELKTMPSTTDEVSPESTTVGEDVPSTVQGQAGDVARAQHVDHAGHRTNAR